MRLITHNMLKCNIRGVEDGYPLRIQAENIEIIESEFDADMIKSMILKINWPALISACSDMAFTELNGLEELNEEAKSDESVLRRIHKVLFDVHLLQGHLVCPTSGRKFPVKDGIPNMLLHEDEV